MAKRQAVLDFSPHGRSAAKRPRTSAGVQYLSFPDGVLDSALNYEAIVQQNNCVGCDGRGLAEGVAKKYPYGCPYAQRRKSFGGRFARSEDLGVPGTVDIRRPPVGNKGPAVLCFMSQWEMGPALKYNRVPTPAGIRDSKDQRKVWFAQCLEQLSKLEPPLSSIAFPHTIGCGLAGGVWSEYEVMILDFATKNPDRTVAIVAQSAGPAKSKGRGRGR